MVVVARPGSRQNLAVDLSVEGQTLDGVGAFQREFGHVRDVGEHGGVLRRVGGGCHLRFAAGVGPCHANRAQEQKGRDDDNIQTGHF